jgi:hypothetical protein
VSSETVVFGRVGVRQVESRPTWMGEEHESAGRSSVFADRLISEETKSVADGRDVETGSGAASGKRFVGIEAETRCKSGARLSCRGCVERR